MNALCDFWFRLLTWMRGQTGAQFDVLIGSHGNELIWRAILRRFELFPLPGVRLRVAHRRAARKGVRHKGKRGQIMNRYPGHPFGNPEERAAWWNLRWLGRRRNDPRVVVVDIHEAPNADLTYFMVGSKVSCAAIVAAYELGYRRCIVSFADSMRVMENAVLLENGIVGANSRERIAHELHLGLRRLSHIGTEDLRARYLDCVGKIHFYFEAEVMIVGPDRECNEWVWPVLAELEAVEAQPLFTPLPSLPEEIEVALGLIPGCEHFFGLWGYNTMSKVWPEAGLTADGRDRKECFGVFYRTAGIPPYTYGPDYVGWIVPEFFHP